MFAAGCFLRAFRGDQGRGKARNRKEHTVGATAAAVGVGGLQLWVDTPCQTGGGMWAFPGPYYEDVLMLILVLLTSLHLLQTSTDAAREEQSQDDRAERFFSSWAQFQQRPMHVKVRSCLHFVWHITRALVQNPGGALRALWNDIWRLDRPSGIISGLVRMQLDVDVIREAADLAAAKNTLRRRDVGASSPPALDGAAHVPLSMTTSGHHPTQTTRSLLAEAGGLAGIRQFTEAFYLKVFADQHLDAFFRDRADPHALRLAHWICEKLGDGAPWTNERAGRQVCSFMAHGKEFKSPTDRSSAHFAAWHSPKRKPGDFGRRFTLADCRVWLRLHFWAMQETGVPARAPSFYAYYLRFIAHFVSVYEWSAPRFVRESERWCRDPENTERYLANGRRMEESLYVMTTSEALQHLPPEERHAPDDWPYDGVERAW